MTATATVPARPAVSVDELKRAWHAVQVGQFRHTGGPHPLGRRYPAHARAHDEAGGGAGSGGRWTPRDSEQVIVVLGTAGSAGASTLALSLALASERPARVVECGPATASGLVSASTAELGTHATGWHQGRRDRVLLERASELVSGPAATSIPTVAAHDGQLTILDIGWEASQVLTSLGWLEAAIRTAPALVLVANATVPGFRRLDAVLDLLGDLDPTVCARMVVAVQGRRRKKWPPGLEHTGGPATARLLENHRVVEVPHDRGLAITGLDSRPLPEPVLDAGARLLDLLGLVGDLTGREPARTPTPAVRDRAEGSRTWSH